MEIEKHAQSYLKELETALEGLSLKKIKSIAMILYEAYKGDKQIFIMGNGGSAATASHFALGLSKNTIVFGKKRFKVIGLADNIPLITAWSNDTVYENIFIEQLHNLLTQGDVVIAISVSGNSKNILKAIEYANSYYAITIGLTGSNGGELKDVVSEFLAVPSDNIGCVEDVHLALTHLIESYLRKKIAGKDA